VYIHSQSVGSWALREVRHFQLEEPVAAYRSYRWRIKTSADGNTSIGEIRVYGAPPSDLLSNASVGGGGGFSGGGASGGSPAGAIAAGGGGGSHNAGRNQANSAGEDGNVGHGSVTLTLLSVDPRQHDPSSWMLLGAPTRGGPWTTLDSRTGFEVTSNRRPAWTAAFTASRTEAAQTVSQRRLATVSATSTSVDGGNIAAMQLSPAGATGRFGPSSTAIIRAFYTPSKWFRLFGGLGGMRFEVEGSGVQAWRVPQTGSYRITCRGAQGGSLNDNENGGRGAVMSGTFELRQGQTLRFLVGQRGQSDDAHQMSGGGGTFVISVSDDDDGLLMVAGGGGAFGPGDASSSAQVGARRVQTCHASIGRNGAYGRSTENTFLAPGGVDGEDGVSNDNENTGGGGGGGYLQGYLVRGGVGDPKIGSVDGSFGGGGHGGSSGSWGSTGGGGGYSGGGGTVGSSVAAIGLGGGGGSYNAGLYQDNREGLSIGHGSITVQLVNDRDPEANAGLMDALGLPKAVAAYSLRRLYGSYRGPVIRVLCGDGGEGNPVFMSDGTAEVVHTSWDTADGRRQGREGGWKVSASTVLSSGVPAWKGFNKTAVDDNDCWHSANTLSASNPEWLSIQYPVPVVLRSYSITARNGTTSIWYPTSWVIQGSNERDETVAAAGPVGRTWNRSGERRLGLRGSSVGTRRA